MNNNTPKNPQKKHTPKHYFFYVLYIIMAAFGFASIAFGVAYGGLDWFLYGIASFLVSGAMKAQSNTTK